MADQILLEGLRFYGYHGVHAEERSRGQRFVVDLVVEIDLHKAGVSDALGDTVSYSEIYRAVRSIVEGPPHDLIESVAEEIATSLLAGLRPIDAVEVTVRKPEVAIPGAHLDAVGVRVRRARARRLPVQRGEPAKPRSLA